jgi:hypothetical protein
MKRWSWIGFACSFVLGCGGDGGGGGGDDDVGTDAGPDAGGDVDAGPNCDDRYGGAPEARADHVSAWIADRAELVVWGGDIGVPVACTPSPEYDDALWVFETDCNTWREIEGGSGPGPRARMAGALDAPGNRLLVFGGRSQVAGGYEEHDDVWALDLATLSWSPVTTSGTGPSARSNTSAVVDAARDRLIVFGGNTSTSGLTFVPQGDTFALDLATGEWSEIAPGTGPDARLFHAAAITADGAAMIVYGGGDENAFFGPFFGDAWALDLATDTWSPISVAGTAPANRISASLAPGGDGVVLFAGHDDGALGNTNDLWTLDAVGSAWTNLSAGDVLDNAAAGFCDFPPDFTVQDPASPERRSAFTLAADDAGGAWLFGGKTDCGLANDVWRLDLASGTWTERRPANQGLSCERQGRVTCESYCL